MLWLRSQSQNERHTLILSNKRELDRVSITS